MTFTENVLFKGNQLDGIFAKHQYHIKKFIDISSPKSAIIATYFCDKNVSGGDPYSLVDRNQKTAWTNEKHREEDMHFNIYFKKNYLMLNSYTLCTVCKAPNHFIVEGSNDNKTFNTIDEVNQSLTEYEEHHFNITNNYQTYRYFRITQIGANTGYAKRLHLMEIEFFGVLFSLQKCSCQYRYSHTFGYSFIQYLLFISVS